LKPVDGLWEFFADFTLKKVKIVGESQGSAAPENNFAVVLFTEGELVSLQLELPQQPV
jgi:hypothetical protein